MAFGKIDASVLWRHIDSFSQEPDDIENVNGPAFKGTLAGWGEVDFGRIPAYDYFDLSSRVKLTDSLTLTMSVQNVFDKKPPLTGATIGSTSFNSGNTYPSTYDTLGRRYAASVKVAF